ncbi:DNA-binding Lrp family transcriptional regulator [Bradyrhizobium elkanii]|jgi:Replication-relaxation|uniref:replication-relaxation family protein n=1 Tax=Bradyrhizobium elkanii TaxID=29448 RepID=UPI00216A60CE|nr:replication-relaxation family protein [Bradyrhizobium elkanii]MCS3476100.1 DNA-binding Lrp family transcriptional regulator [Bradyrhizobium elkanii]
MNDNTPSAPTRRTRFRRASEPPAFRVTDNDVVIVRLLARHRFLRSTHIAALVGRSIDRTNDRLSRLFHAGYIDRPRAQLDYYPTAGSAPMVYALADLGAHLLRERDHSGAPDAEWSRKNREVGRPFIEHQLEIIDFQVALECAVRKRTDIRLIHSDELIAAFPEQTRAMRNPLAMRVGIVQNGKTLEIGLIPDLIVGIGFFDGSRRCFIVEIDRGTMPIVRADIRQTSFLRKMRVYLAAHAAKQHESQFGWKAFRVITVTVNRDRARSIQEALRELQGPQGLGANLFLLALRDKLHASDPIAYTWEDGAGRLVKLV